jgi:ribonuclease BN (tRNA processing enzyme)
MTSKLTFLGCGDAFGSGGRLNTCFLVEAGDARFLIDCGATSLAAMKRAGVSADSVPLIFITHLHGDHVGGLPFLLLEAALVHKRTAPLTVAGPPGLKAHLPKLTDALFPGTPLELPFELNVIELAPDMRAEVLGVGVTPHLVKHAPTLVCTGLRFELEDELGDKVLAYSGDTVWTDTLPSLAGGADLFICDAYTYDGSTAQHLDYATLQGRYAELGPKRLILTHLGQAFLDRLEAGDTPECETAEDGLVVQF